jgi:hypothetical protein
MHNAICIHLIFDTQHRGGKGFVMLCKVVFLEPKFDGSKDKCVFVSLQCSSLHVSVVT